MKQMKFMLGLLLISLVGLMTMGCGETTGSESTTTAQTETSIAGEYIIDITDLGMPLQFYLKIDADDNFYLSPDRSYEVDKGHGVVGNSQDTYMLIYSDSTTDEPKNSTFTVENNNLHFSTNLPYGASSLPASKVDDNDPDITYYLVAKTLMYETYYAEYAGEHSVSAMGSEVTYAYYLQLGEGREFKFVSDYSMSGTDYQYLESGYYDISGSNVILHLDGEDVTGSFNEDNNLQIPVKPSDMGDREERTLQIATTASCASTYYGYAYSEMGGTTMYDAQVTLVLDKFGGYSYTAADTVNGTVTETGSFSIDGSQISFSPADSDQNYTATLENFIFTGAFEVSTESTTRVDLTLYCKTVQGEFTATGEDEAENQYYATLNLYSDGTFDFVILYDQEQTLLDKQGTFTISRMMFVQLTLTAEDQTTYSCVVSEVGLNVNIEIGTDNEVGFILMKSE